MKKTKVEHSIDIKLFTLLIVGSFLRLFYIGNIPGNTALYSDELFSGYESWSLLKYGYDYLGYHFPVYLPVWGGGMSCMQALIQMPFIAFFGLNSFALRLPAAILGCITIYAFFYICQKIRGIDFAYFAAFILAVMPWHIIQSRWALDCNYFVGFMAISMALFLKALDDNKYLPLSFLFFGLTLYTYALPWMVMPVLVIASTLYMVIHKKITINKYFFISIAILAVLALPLLLFLLVNYGFMEEIRTSVFSIPKLSHFRSNEFTLSPKALIKNFYDTFMLFVSQDDGRVGDVAPAFGLYYKFSNVFIVIGIGYCLVNAYNKAKEKELNLEAPLLIQFVCALILGSVTEIFFSRINIIHIPMTYFLSVGLWAIIDIVKKHAKEVIIVIYALACMTFILYYFTYHDDAVAKAYDDGCKAALEYVDDKIAEGTIAEESQIHLLSGVFFTHVIFYEKYPTDQYIEDVEYADPQITGNRIPRKVGKYDLSHCVEGTPLGEPTKNDVYICSDSDTEALEYMKEHEMQMEYFNYIVVGIN